MGARDAQASFQVPVFSRLFSDSLPAAMHSGPTGPVTDSSTSSSAATSEPVDFPDLARLMSASRREVHNGFWDAVTRSTSSTSHGRIRDFLAACHALPELLRTHTSVTEQDCEELHKKDPSVYPIMDPAVLSRVLSTRSHLWLRAVESREVAVPDSWFPREQLHGYLSQFADGPSVDIILSSAAGEESFRLPFLTLAWEIAEAIVEPHKRELSLAAEIRSAAAALDESTRAAAETVAERVGDALCRHAGLIDVCDKFFRPIGLVGRWTTVAENKFTYEVEVPESSEAIVKLVESLALAMFDVDPLYSAKDRRKIDASDVAALQRRFPFCPISFANDMYSLQLFHLLPAREGSPAFDSLVLGLERHAPRYYHPLPGTPAPWSDFNPEHGVNGESTIIRVSRHLNYFEDWVLVLKWPPTHCPPDALPHSILPFFPLGKVSCDGLSDPRTVRVAAGADRNANSSTPSLTFWNLSGRAPPIVPNWVRYANPIISALTSPIASVTGMTGIDATFADTAKGGHATTPYPIHDAGFPPPFIWDFAQSQRFVNMYGTSAVSAIQTVAEEMLGDDLIDALEIAALDDFYQGSQDARSGTTRLSPSTGAVGTWPPLPQDTAPSAPGGGLSAHTYACLYVLLRLMLAGRPQPDEDEDDRVSGFSADIETARGDAQVQGLGRDAIADWQNDVCREQENARSAADRSS